MAEQRKREGRDIDEEEGCAGLAGHSKELGFGSMCDEMVSSFPLHLE